jgi:hypothetical protein
MLPPLNNFPYYSAATYEQYSQLQCCHLWMTFPKSFYLEKGFSSWVQQKCQVLGLGSIVQIMAYVPQGVKNLQICISIWIFFCIWALRAQNVPFLMLHLYLKSNMKIKVVTDHGGTPPPLLVGQYMWNNENIFIKFFYRHWFCLLASWCVVMSTFILLRKFSMTSLVGRTHTV